MYAVANDGKRLEIPEGPLGKLISGILHYNILLYITDALLYFIGFNAFYIYQHNLTCYSMLPDSEKILYSV